MRKFGTHTVLYDVVIDHDIYEYLRITLEVPRNQSTKAIVTLRGVPVGEIVFKDKKYIPFRYGKTSANKKRLKETSHPGLAAAKIVTNLL